VRWFLQPVLSPQLRERLVPAGREEKARVRLSDRGEVRAGREDRTPVEQVLPSGAGRVSCYQMLDAPSPRGSSTRRDILVAEPAAGTPVARLACGAGAGWWQTQGGSSAHSTVTDRLIVLEPCPGGPPALHHPVLPSRFSARRAPGPCNHLSDHPVRSGGCVCRSYRCRPPRPFRGRVSSCGHSGLVPVPAASRLVAATAVRLGPRPYPCDAHAAPFALFLFLSRSYVRVRHLPPDFRGAVSCNLAEHSVSKDRRLGVRVPVSWRPLRSSPTQLM